MWSRFVLAPTGFLGSQGAEWPEDPGCPPGVHKGTAGMRSCSCEKHSGFHWVRQPTGLAAYPDGMWSTSWAAGSLLGLGQVPPAPARAAILGQLFPAPRNRT